MKSKISVALCTYNGEKFIQKQLDSIVNQTITVDEIILCDDCSKDNTVNIINKYIEKYPSLFKLFINETNLKSNANFEKAIQLTTGDYIFLADQDDVWRNDKVEKTLAIFNKNKKAEGVFSNANFIDENDNRIYDKLTLWEFVSFFENENFNPKNIKKLLINKGNYLTGATLCIKKEVKAFSIPFKTGDDFIHDRDRNYGAIVCHCNVLLA
jgi:glycosyltransferase involved in cell wall biosynthesis